MKFDLEISFTGLGLTLIHEKKRHPGVVTGVELLIVDTSKADHVHLPRLTFALDDLASTGEGELDYPHTSASGSPLIENKLDGTDLAVVVTGGRGPFEVKKARRVGAHRPRPGAPRYAIGWLPDIATDLGLTDYITPGGSLKDSPYTARVTLPPGNVSSRSLILNPNGSVAEFTFGDDGPARVLAEQLVWTRREVSKVEIQLGNKFWLDAKLRMQRRERPLVQVAITNLPAAANPERYRDPDHFPMFRNISKGMKIPKKLRRKGGHEVTRGGACPPALAEVLA